ncbi:MAG: histidine ammonia-lyase [Thermoplasmata archaeon]
MPIPRQGGQLIVVDGESLTVDDVVQVSRNLEEVRLSPEAARRMEESRKTVVEILKSDRLVYGINTGFGELADVVIPDREQLDLQRNLVRSHCAGVGENLEEEYVRASMLLRANSLAKGFSGVRVEVVGTLIEMLNRRVHPVVPEIGSVGASGDLAQLAHIAAVLMGEGLCIYDGNVLEGDSGMKRAKINPLVLEQKEGVALINGTSVLTGIATLLIFDSLNLVKHAQIAASMSFEALKSSPQPLDKRLGSLRPHKGHVKCARNMLRLLKGSEIVQSHKDCSRVQDAYTIRCIPQVIGSVIDAVDYAGTITEIEVNSVTDNPLVFAESGETLSCGNFHGQPVAIAMDHLSLAMCILGSFSERRIARLVDSHLSGLPPFLTEKSGTHSGLMMAQCTAAALTSENKVLAHPASADSIPTSAGQEDYVSMGLLAARNAASALKNSRKIIALEFICAAQGLDFLRPLKPGGGVRTAHDVVRQSVRHLSEDRPLTPDVDRVLELMEDRTIHMEVEKEAGKLL